MNICNDCGMIVSTNEYHPYAACLMFKSCKSGAVVRSNLSAVVDKAINDELATYATITRVVKKT